MFSLVLRQLARFCALAPAVPLHSHMRPRILFAVACQVRHDYNELLQEGQEVVLTLVDKGILDERGRSFNEAAEEDELENVLKVGGPAMGAGQCAML